MRAALSIVTFMLALGAVTGCGGPEDETHVIRLAHGLPTTHPVHAAMVQLAEGVAERSAGTMRIDIYPGEQLGTEREALELMQIGSIGITKVSAAVMESFAPDYEVLSLPYVFRDEAHGWAVLDGPVGRSILDSGEAVRLRGLCFYDAGRRSFYTVDRPVEGPDDLAGLKIRVQESPTAKALVNAFDASATPIPWGELYGALQQGIVDGAENNPPSFHLSGHYEIARHYCLNEHTFVPDVLLVSTHTWEALTAEQQVWLQAAADESAVFQRELWREASEEALAAVEAAGVTIVRPDRAAFAARTAALLESYRIKPRLAELLDLIAATESG